VPYLAALGTGAIYLAPIFEARRGAGTATTSPTRPGAVRGALGGEPALPHAQVFATLPVSLLVPDGAA
jgi:maltooligosyltrehalose synthase